jgi:hypothetical protein
MPAYPHIAALLLAAALFSACAEDGTTAPARPGFRVEDAGHNAADHFKIDEPVEFDLINPCNAEPIHVVGRDVGQINAVDKRENLDNGNSVHFEHLSHVVAAGTGQVTGTAYNINDIFHESFNSPSPPAPQVTISFRETLRVTSLVPGMGFSVHMLFHLVLEPSADEAKVTQDVESTTCGR